MTIRSPLKMSEAQLQDAVVDLARTLGWRVFHARPARTKDGWRTPVAYDGAGFLDLVLVRTRVIFAEVKSERGDLSKHQERWLDALLDAHAQAVVIRPEDWRCGGVEEMLRAKVEVG